MTATPSRGSTPTQRSPACGGADLAALLAGRRRRRLREVGQRARRRAGGRPATIPARRARRTNCAADVDQALSLIPGTHRFNLHAFYGEFGGKPRRPRRDRPRALRRLDRLGQGDWASASTSTRLTSRIPKRPTASRCRTPTTAIRAVLDRPRHRLPADRRGDRQGARHAVRHERLDSRRHEGHADRPRRPARAAGRNRSTPSSPNRSTRATTSTRSRASCSASAARAYAVGSHEFYFGYALSRAEAALTLDAGHYHPTETITDKISSRAAVPRRRSCSTSAAASAGTATTSSLLTDDLEAIAPGARPRRLPRPHAHRPRLLRRQHQPRRRLGDRHAQHDQGAAQGAARADGETARRWKRPATTPSRLALLEELKTLPFGAVWDYYCETKNVPGGSRVAGAGRNGRKMCSSKRRLKAIRTRLKARSENFELSVKSRNRFACSIEHIEHSALVFTPS